MAKIKLRRDTAVNWSSSDSVLALGEPGYDTTNNKLKIGNGTSTWSVLTFLTDVQGADGTYTPTTPANWLGSPTVGTVVAGLDELAGRVTTVESAPAITTGDVTFNGVKVIGAGTASGDGFGYATLELVPDGTLATDQYIVVDPTTPNHIHLRAGGTQDASTAELYLGGERNNVRVSDYSGVKLNNNLLATNTTRPFSNTIDFTNATWSVIEPGVYYLRFSTTLQELQTVHDQFGSWPDNTIEISDGTNFYTLTYNAYSGYLGNPNDRVIQVREAPPGGTTVTVQSMTFTINTLQSNYLSLENNVFETYANDYAYIGASQTIELVTGTGNLKISVNDNINSRSWYFNTKGHLEFPQGVAPTTSKGSAGDEIGAVAFDGTHIYYCVESYSDGVNDIWKRVAWSNDTW